MSPIPKDRAVLIDEGWHSGHIMGIPRIIEKKTIKGPSLMMTVKIKTCVPDSEGETATVFSNVFIYEDTSGGGSNWGYEAFLKALKIPDAVMTDEKTGQQFPALPDPDPETYESMPVRIKIYHDTYKGKTRNQVKEWAEWDGKDEEGIEYKAPERELAFGPDEQSDWED